MIVFCTECWYETDSSHKTCPRCGADLSINLHSYGHKLISALDHTLPEARVRACWLIGLNQIQDASAKLMLLATDDPDLFVRLAAVQALGKIHASDAIPFLQSLVGQENHRMDVEARKSLLNIENNTVKTGEASQRQGLSGDVEPNPNDR